MFSDKNTGGDRIFISYRRADTTGYAGRLADSLDAYFGKDRIFRDVGSIEPGADFTEGIAQSLRQAGACIVLIGPRWLVSEDGGKPRLHDPDDYVAGEIAAALESRRPVIPVLVEGATMPRADDLPKRLSELARRNAVTITDERWHSDVTRLARVLALDVSGSAMEGRLTLWKKGVLFLLTLANLWTILRFSVAAAPTITATVLHPVNVLLNFIAIGLVTAGLMYVQMSVAPDSRPYLLATILVGGIGAVTSVLYYTLRDGQPVVVIFAASTCVTTVMLALLAMSGFKPNDRVT